MQSLFDFYKSNKSYTSAGVTDEHSYFLTNAGRLGRLKLENVGGEKPLSTLHSSCGSSQSASLQVPDDAKQFDFASETWKFLASTVGLYPDATLPHPACHIPSPMLSPNRRRLPKSRRQKLKSALRSPPPAQERRSKAAIRPSFQSSVRIWRSWRINASRTRPRLRGFGCVHD